MSDIMRPIPFGKLMGWVLTEYKESGSVFGVSKLARHEGGRALPMFKEKIESPFGPAAGPTPSWPRISWRLTGQGPGFLN